MSVHPTATIHPSADVHPNAVIGAFCEIGQRANVQNGAVIGAGTRVERGAWVCQFADVGAGCVIVEHSSVASHAGVPAGTVVDTHWPRTPQPVIRDFKHGGFVKMAAGEFVRMGTAMHELIRNTEDAMASMALLGIDFANIEARSIAHERRMLGSWDPPKPDAKWGGVANPATNRFLNPEVPTKRFAKTWNLRPNGYTL